MHEVNYRVDSLAAPSVRGAVGGKKLAPKVEIAVDSASEVLEVKIGKDVETRLLKAIKFEKRRWPYILALPVMWLLTLWVMAKKGVYELFGFQPAINTLLFDGLGVLCRKVKEGAASWRALDIIYRHSFTERHSLGGLVDEFWWRNTNCQAIRNRFKLAKTEIKQAMRRFEGCGEVRIISLACGSAQAVIESMAELKKEGILSRAILVDVDQSALDYASNLAKENGVSDQVVAVKRSACQIARISRDFKPHIVEMVGLLDYLERKKAIRLFSKIRESLENNGIFLTCNIAPNMEMYFVKWVINWQMVYRTAGQLAEVIERAGFQKFRLVAEPLKIHNLAICQKSA